MSGNSTPTITANVALLNNATINTAAAGDSLTVAGTLTGTGTGITKTGSGVLTLNGAVTGQSIVASGGRINFGAGNTTAGQFNHTLTLLTINNNSSVQFSLGGTRVVTTNALTISGNGFLDLTDNGLVLDYPGATADPAQLAAVRTLLASGFAGGAWNGAGHRHQPRLEIT